MSGRIKAFLIHLGISLVVLAVLLYIVIFIWYPPPFFAYDGGWQGVRLIAGVDIVLGPLLTLMIYNPSKGMRKLKRDLAIIAIIQFSSLAAGTWIVADQRTAMVTFANNRFVSMNQTQVKESGVTEEVLSALKINRPPMAFVQLPDDASDRNELIMSNLGGKPLFKRGDLYQPLTTKNRLKIVEQGFALEDVAAVSDELATSVREFLARVDKRAGEVVALPLYCRYGVVSLVLDRKNGEIIDTLEVSHDQLLASLSQKRLKDGKPKGEN